MKSSFTIVMLLFSIACFSQSLNLNISNPQPRLGERFTVSVDIDSLSKTFFTSLAGDFKLTPGRGTNGQPQSIIIDAEAKSVGKKEIGPLKLEINGVQYSTNKLTFDVVDSLPAVNQGVWIRNIAINDSTFAILIDQRMPALTYVTREKNAIQFTTKANEDNEVEIITDRIGNVRSAGSTGTSDTKTIYLPNNEVKFKRSFWVYTFIITDKTKPVKLTKTAFSNLPAYYKFKDIDIN